MPRGAGAGLDARTITPPACHGGGNERPSRLTMLPPAQDRASLRSWSVAYGCGCTMLESIIWCLLGALIEWWDS